LLAGAVTSATFAVALVPVLFAGLRKSGIT
jgi:hypothetical protein